MSGSLLSAFQAKNATWQGVFVIGVAGLGLAGLKAWWGASPPAVYQPPSLPAALPTMIPAPAPVAMPSAPASGASKIVRTVPPVSSFTPSRIAPADLPPELAGLSRPPPDPPPYVAPVGVQPGYAVPEGPQARDIR